MVNIRMNANTGRPFRPRMESGYAAQMVMNMPMTVNSSVTNTV